jgi:hypothetical protein
VSENQPPPGDPGSDPARGPVRRLRVRRAPRYEVFIGAGALVGLLLAVVTGGTGVADPQTGRAKLIGYLAMGLMLVGGLLGGAVAVALEAFSRRSRITVDRPRKD